MEGGHGERQDSRDTWGGELRRGKRDKEGVSTSPGSKGDVLETTWEERVSAGEERGGEQRIHSKAQARLRVPSGQSQVQLGGGKGGARC